ncbi:MAG: RagB/SusD family nutrient uptake outer membrane protein [Culturomica sp.]|jgi:hypothetical protein|nr:RagB/SusD family nutrient uptake outer membrane protein [Culturomica sp.]
MKKIAILLVSLALASCESWLDVKEADRMMAEDVYKLERETNKALNGLYLQLTSESLYAKNLSCGMLDILGQRYLSGSEHAYNTIQTYSFEESATKSTLLTTWSAAYKTIANCNEFLDRIDNNKEHFTQAHYLQYKGEAIAIRTLLHFDMLRLFGPVYGPDTQNEEAVPYYDQVYRSAAEFKTASMMARILLSDIASAIEYLKEDPILSGNVKNPNSVRFFTDYRHLRMNIYAAWVLKARIHHYLGTPLNVQEAYKITSSLLAGKNPADEAATCNFPMVIRSVDHNDGSKTAEMVYDPEIIFGIHNLDRPDLHKANFSTDLENKRILAGGVDYVNNMYDISADIRRKMWVLYPDRDFYAFVRFAGGTATDFTNQLQCIIRLGEVYLIAAETAPDAVNKRKYLEALRLSRALAVDNTIGYSDEQLGKLIEDEYIREFAGEGQYFYYAKRNNLAAVKAQNGNQVAPKYVMPLPESEIDLR